MLSKTDLTLILEASYGKRPNKELLTLAQAKAAAWIEAIDVVLYDANTLDEKEDTHEAEPQKKKPSKRARGMGPSE